MKSGGSEKVGSLKGGRAKIWTRERMEVEAIKALIGREVGVGGAGETERATNKSKDKPRGRMGTARDSKALGLVRAAAIWIKTKTVKGGIRRGRRMRTWIFDPGLRIIAVEVIMAKKVSKASIVSLLTSAGLGERGITKRGMRSTAREAAMRGIFLTMC